MVTNLINFMIAASAVSLIICAIRMEKIVLTQKKFTEKNIKLFDDVSMSNPGKFNDKVVERQNKVLEKIWERAPKY